MLRRLLTIKLDIQRQDDMVLVVTPDMRERAGSTSELVAYRGRAESISSVISIEEVPESAEVSGVGRWVSTLTAYLPWCRSILRNVIPEMSVAMV